GGAVKPFASGGIIGTPTYFPLRSGGVGLAGEAGPEAIMPLARGPDGRLGVAASGGGGARITVNIATPDANSFRRSE
ncbi:MAG: phage tail tape measure protein, partial [Gemmobacter sp.]